MTEQPDNNRDNDNNKNSDYLKKPNLLQVTLSVLSAIFGVQTGKNRERDFKKGNPADFIGVYIVNVIHMVIGMILLVKSVLKNAGV